jgi:hypothetical protein
MAHDFEQKGIYIHMDLNPENVFLSVGGETFQDGISGASQANLKS